MNGNIASGLQHKLAMYSTMKLDENKGMEFVIVSEFLLRLISHAGYIYRPRSCKLMKDGSEKSYWTCVEARCPAKLHTTGSVVVKVLQMHTCGAKQGKDNSVIVVEENCVDFSFSEDSNTSISEVSDDGDIDESFDLPILEDLSDCLTNINKPSQLDTQDIRLLHSQSLIKLLNDFHAVNEESQSDQDYFQIGS